MKKEGYSAVDRFHCPAGFLVLRLKTEGSESTVVAVP